MQDVGSGLDMSVDELAAASTARFATPPAAGSTGEQPQATDAAGVAGEAPNPPGETPTKVKPDVSWADDGLRADLESLPAQVVEKLRPYILRQGDYTRKTQELAEQRKAIGKAEEDANLWRQLVSDPTRASAVVDILNGRTPAAGRKAPVFDWATATSEEIDAEVTRRAEQISDSRARKAAEEVIRERVEKPLSKADAIRGAVREHRAHMPDLTDEQYRSAWQATIERYGEANLVTLEPDVVIRLFEPVAESYLYKSRWEAFEKSKQAPGRVAAAASVPGTASVTPQRNEFRTVADKLRATAATLGVSPEDIERLASGS